MQQRANRYFLGALLGLLALDAFAGGYHAMAGVAGAPVEWLQGSPARSFALGLILFVAVAVAAATAAVAVLARHRRGLGLARLAGWILVIWQIEQLAILGFVSWLQPATAAAAIAILVLAYQPARLPPAWRTS